MTYREEEILEARAVLSNFCKLYKRKGSERMRNTMEDIVKAILNPDLHLPVFYAIDLSRQPPTDVNHCDMSAVMLELQALHREVRDLKRFEQEISDLREQLSCVDRSGRSVVDGTIPSNDFPPLNGSATGPEIVGGMPENGKYAQLAKDLHETGFTVVRSHRTKSKKEPVVGSSTSNKHVSSVTTTRVLDMFVSRLHPHTINSNVKT